MISINDNWKCLLGEAGMRVDKFLSERVTDVSRAQIQEWMADNCFSVNDKPIKKRLKLKTGDIIKVISMPEIPITYLVPENIPLEIVYEDEHIVVINKPKGLVVHPGSGNRIGTLANGLAYHFKSLSSVNDPLRPGILHRLDKNTSGLLLTVKTNAAHLQLSKDLEDRKISRKYRALVWNQMEEAEGTVDKPIGRHPNNPVKMTVIAGRNAVTHWKVLQYYSFATQLELALETGRTHQIRVHMLHLGNPVIGDPLYGGRNFDLNQIHNSLHTGASKLFHILQSQALHAAEISFIHPFTKERMTFFAPTPDDFNEAVKVLDEYKEDRHRFE